MIKQGQLLGRTPSLDVTKIMYFVLLAARLALLVSCASATLGSRVHDFINEHDDAPARRRDLPWPLRERTYDLMMKRSLLAILVLHNTA